MNNLTNIKYIGVNDHNIDLFEGQYPVPNGMSYNSYLICDEKIAVLDTVDKNFGDEWLDNITNIIGERKPDFLVLILLTIKWSLTKVIHFVWANTNLPL